MDWSSFGIGVFFTLLMEAVLLRIIGWFVSRSMDKERPNNGL